MYPPNDSGVGSIGDSDAFLHLYMEALSFLALLLMQFKVKIYHFEQINR